MRHGARDMTRDMAREARHSGSSPDANIQR